MRIGPITIGESAPTVSLREQAQEIESQYNESYSILRERLAELELALEDQGWQRMMTEGEREFSRTSLRTLCSLSRMAYLKNPLISRAVDLQAHYVFGQGVDIQAKEETAQQIVQDFLDDPANKVELTSHQARMLKEVDLAVLGQIFFVFFTDLKGATFVRSLPVDEVEDIICNPEDGKEVWFYKRVFKKRIFNTETGNYEGGQQTVYYPDWRYNPAPSARVSTVGRGDPVAWDSPVYHIKTGGMSEMRFGVPETYAALDWARAYKDFLEDWATIVRSLSRFAWKMTAPNGARGVAAAKTRLNSTLGTGAVESNPPPVAGATFIAGSGSDMQPMKTAGATVSADDGRRLLLMVAAATGFPETFFGDVSVGTLATAKSLDRPTELKMRSRQTLWSDAFKDILAFVVNRKTNAVASDVFVDAEAVEIDVTFPPLLEHDVVETVDAIITAATLDGKKPAGTIPPEQLVRLLLSALGVDDAEDILKDLDLERLEPPDLEDAPQLPAPGQAAVPTPQQEAYRELVEAVRDLQAKIGGAA